MSFLGTQLVDERSRKRLRSQLDDEGGRKLKKRGGSSAIGRFHGAFEGGFSAGYHNTVGSADGWTPSQKKLSKRDIGDEDDFAGGFEVVVRDEHSGSKSLGWELLRKIGFGARFGEWSDGGRLKHRTYVRNGVLRGVGFKESSALNNMLNKEAHYDFAIDVDDELNTSGGGGALKRSVAVRAKRPEFEVLSFVTSKWSAKDLIKLEPPPRPARFDDAIRKDPIKKKIVKLDRLSDRFTSSSSTAIARTESTPELKPLSSVRRIDKLPFNLSDSLLERLGIKTKRVLSDSDSDDALLDEAARASLLRAKSALLSREQPNEASIPELLY